MRMGVTTHSQRFRSTQKEVGGTFVGVAGAVPVRNLRDCTHAGRGISLMFQGARNSKMVGLKQILHMTIS